MSHQMGLSQDQKKQGNARGHAHDILRQLFKNHVCKLDHLLVDRGAGLAGAGTASLALQLRQAEGRVSTSIYHDFRRGQ